VYNEEYAKFQEMVDDLNEIGAGLSEYLISLKSNYGLGNDLACVLDSYYNGELARDWIQTNPGLSHLTLHNETQKFCAAWQENDEVVRKSVAHVWITRGLTPMRAFVNTVTPDIEEACTTRENMRKDADSYRRRYNLATKAMQSAATPEKKAEKQQEQVRASARGASEASAREVVVWGGAWRPCAAEHMCGRAHVRPSTCATSPAAGGVRGVSPRQPEILPAPAAEEQLRFRAERASVVGARVGCRRSRRL
jgi:hypothetical protein